MHHMELVDGSRHQPLSSSLASPIWPLPSCTYARDEDMIASRTSARHSLPYMDTGYGGELLHTSTGLLTISQVLDRAPPGSAPYADDGAGVLKVGSRPSTICEVLNLSSGFSQHGLLISDFLVLVWSGRRYGCGRCLLNPAKIGASANCWVFSLNPAIRLTMRTDGRVTSGSPPPGLQNPSRTCGRRGIDGGATASPRAFWS